MFIILMILIIYTCIFSIYVVYKLLEAAKDLNTLYDNYSDLLQKSYELKKGANVKCYKAF